MIVRIPPGLLVAVSLVLTLESCSDVEHYPAGPVPLETPSRVTDADLTYDVDSRDAVLRWTAPDASAQAEGIVRYEIRYVYDGSFEWDSASSVLDPPAPAAAGTAQEYRFHRPTPGSSLSAAVAAVDDAGKVSTGGNVAFLHVPGFRFSGRVIDLFTHDPVPGVGVEASGEVMNESVTTGAGGEFELSDVRPQHVTVSIRNDPAKPRFFDLVQQFEFTADVDTTFVVIPHRMADRYPDVSMLSLFRAATEIYWGGGTAFRKWKQIPVPLHMAEFTNVYGLDYRRFAVEAANRWMELTGIQLWEVVDQPRPWGVEITVRPLAELAPHIAVTHHEQDSEGYPLRSDIDIADSIPDSTQLRQVLLHELGHTIRLAHLPSGYLMYAGQPLPPDPLPDEILVVRMIHGMPNGTDMSIYREVTSWAGQR